MPRMRFPVIPAAFLLAFVVLAVFLGSLQAETGPNASTDPGSFTLIASNLHNPRGLSFGPDGALYIAEAGAGGDGACVPGPEGEQCYGPSGAVSKVVLDEAGNPISQERIATGLVSLGEKESGDGATGPNDVAFNNSGEMFVIVGLGADPALRDPAGALGPAGMNFGQLVAVDDEGNWSNVLDIAAYESANNPDGAQLDSNPYALLETDDGFLVVDAGGNDLLKASLDTIATNKSTAEISTVAVFPTRMVEFPPGTGQMIPIEAVPTAVEMGPDGAYYVSQLTGGPFPVGEANIYRVEAGEEPQVYLSGFTNVLDLAWGPDGSLFILEMAKDGLASPPPIGRIIQATPYGARSTIASDGLIAPVDMEIGPDHALYVINSGPSATMGEVVRITLPSSTAVINASQDTTLYESESGALSNGAGQHIFAGKTADRTGNLIRRGLLAFDVQSALPDGATVVSATVKLNMSRSGSDDKQVMLHKVAKEWGEGASDAEGEEGAGAAAENNDATWLHTFFESGTWDTAGGDFEMQESASTVVGGVGPYSWSSTQLASDVQEWLNGSSTNAGWILLGDESGDASAKRFDSRENPEPAKRPKLTVTYIAPLPDYISFVPLVNSAD